MTDTGGMSIIRVTAHYRVKSEKANQFRQFAAALVERARQSERGGTSAYAFYQCSYDPTLWIVHETFEDADAFERHVHNMTPEFRAASDLFDLIRADICGLPTAVANRLLGPSPVHHLFDSLIDSI